MCAMQSAQWKLRNGDDPVPFVAAREELVRAALPPELADTVLDELRAARRPPTLRNVLCFLFGLVLFAAGAVMFFPAERFRGMLTDTDSFAALPATGSYRSVLEEARTLQETGEPIRANALLLEATRELLRNGDPEQLRANEALLETRWRWNQDDRATIRRETRRALRFVPDLPAARYFLAAVTLPAEPIPQVPFLSGEERQKLEAEAAEQRSLLLPYRISGAEVPEQRAALLYMLALADTTLWALGGFADDPGEPGFAEREEALELTQHYRNERRFVRLRRDILQKIWEVPWYAWNYQTIGGRRMHYTELKREIDSLSGQLELK